MITKTDSYKFSHYRMYPPGLTDLSAYVEARSGGDFKEVTFFGLQMYLMEISKAIMLIKHSHQLVVEHGLPFNVDDWWKIRLIGYLPLEIQALPEGLTVPTGTPLVQVRNTDPRFAWLTTYIETALLRAVWYPSTVATLSRGVKKVIQAALEVSSEDPYGQLPFKLHDFGGRGATSSESAGIGGCAHLVNFKGTDTFEGILYARSVYGADMPGYSIPAAEHSTITAWGEDGEERAYTHIISEFAGKDRMVSIVADSYDVDKAVGIIFGVHLKDEILRSRGTIVIRPDSGDPVETPLRIIKVLADRFGAHKNAKGYYVLHPSVRVIQGDGMTPATIKRLIDRLLEARLSVDNIAFGMGGGLLQGVTRDTIRFSMKASEAIVNGEVRDIRKSPKTDPMKASRAGRQAVVYRDGQYVTMLERDIGADDVNLLQPVWRDGKLLKKWTFDEVRAAAELPRMAVQTVD